MNKFRTFAAATAIAGALSGFGAIANATIANAATGSEASDLLTAQCGDREVKGKACHNVSRPSGYNTRSSVQGEVRESSRGQVLGGVRVTPGGFNAPSGAPEPWEWMYDERAAGGINRANSGGPGYGG